MNYNFIPYIILSIFLIGCWETKPKWEDSSFDFSNISLDSTEINEFSYGGLSSCTDSLSVYSTFGFPDTISVKSSNDQLLNNLCFFNCEMVVGRYIDGYKIRYINFDEPSLNASLNGLRLDSNTSLKQAKSVFPNSFDWRNLGIAESAFELREKYGNQKVKFDYMRIILVDENRFYVGRVELSFIDNELEQIRIERPQDIIQK